MWCAGRSGCTCWRSCAWSRNAYTPDTTWPIHGHPPGSSRELEDLPGFGATSGLTTLRQRFALARLPDPHLTHHVRLFLIAHHDGHQPTQHEVVWHLPP